jgi:SAM-dependent methyltransferase
MPRIPETEVMTDPATVQAYAAMTKAPPTLVYTTLLPTLPTNNGFLKIADIGCGPCGYHNGLYEKYPNAVIDAYDASVPMLVEAANYINPQKTTLINSFLPDANLPQAAYDLVWSSVFLHQLPDPAVCWSTIKQLGKPGGSFIVYDLIRVEDANACWSIINTLTPNAPDVFKQDFFTTLRACFTAEEITAQIAEAGLNASVDVLWVQLPDGTKVCQVVCVKGTM